MQVGVEYEAGYTTHARASQTAPETCYRPSAAPAASPPRHWHGSQRLLAAGPHEKPPRLALRCGDAAVRRQRVTRPWVRAAKHARKHAARTCIGEHPHRHDARFMGHNAPHSGMPQHYKQSRRLHWRARDPVQVRAKELRTRGSESYHRRPPWRVG